MKSESTTDRYARAKEIFFAALEIDSSEHAELLERACADDSKLRQEVESLLTMRDNARDFFRLPEFETASGSDAGKNEIFSGYHLIREIGCGGMGIVFLAEKNDGGICQRAAVKLVRNDFCSKGLRKRFDLERQILNSLEHSNIARLLDAGTGSEGSAFFAMEYVDGTPLNEYADAKNLKLAERVELFGQVCSAVAYAHQRGVIHRDLKPSNILVTAEGAVKLLDFGIARLFADDGQSLEMSRTTIRAMTPEFSSPEQVKGEIVTTTTDVYSLGVILYELLTGKRPYKIGSESINEIIRAVCETNPEPPSTHNNKLRGDLDNILLKALRKEPERRYSSVEALGEDLRRFFHGLPVSARRDTFNYRLGKFIGRNRVAAGFAGLGVVLLLVGTAAAIWQGRRAEVERARAERRFSDVRSLTSSFMFELNDEILRGQTGARELLVKRAIQYLDLLAAETTDDTSLRRELAVAFLKIGDIQGKPFNPNLGDTDGALASYRKGLDILQELHETDAANLDIRGSLAAAYLSIGSIQAVRTLERRIAIENLQKARFLCEALIEAVPADKNYHRILADVFKALGDALDNPDERLSAYRKALEMREGLAAEDLTDPADLTATASINQRLGMLMQNAAETNGASEKYNAALAHYDRSRAIYQQLIILEPENSRHRRNFADMTAMRMPVFANLGNRRETLDSFETAVKEFEALSDSDPKNAEARLDVALTYYLKCQSLLTLNERSDGVGSCRQGLFHFEAMLPNDLSNRELRYYISESHKSIVKALKESGHTREENEALHRLFAVAEKFSSSDSDDPFGPFNKGEICLLVGEMNERLAGMAARRAKRKSLLQEARNWYVRGLEFFRETQQVRAAGTAPRVDFDAINEMIARCDTALR